MNRKDREQLRHWRRLLANPTAEGALYYAKKYMNERTREGKPVPEFDPQAMLAGVHKVRVEISDHPVWVNESRKWLSDHGFNETMAHSKHNE